jgi:Rps23 Pro-64 3,4-dihydroxylase Tpa1-like proline 4-hydroxylase
MQNYLDATPKATFYINELSCELAELFIQHTYEHTSQPIYKQCKNGDIIYTDFIQDEFNMIIDKIETYLENNKLNKQTF